MYSLFCSIIIRVISRWRHNGNIVNADLLRTYLENKGSLFQSTSDSEVFAHLIKKEVRKTTTGPVSIRSSRR